MKKLKFLILFPEIEQDSKYIMFQVLLINAVKDVASALADLISATKNASGKNVQDPAMFHLKDSAKVYAPCMHLFQLVIHDCVDIFRNLLTSFSLAFSLATFLCLPFYDVMKCTLILFMFTRNNQNVGKVKWKICSDMLIDTHTCALNFFQKY